MKDNLTKIAYKLLKKEGFTINLKCESPTTGYALAITKKSKEFKLPRINTLEQASYFLQMYMQNNIVPLFNGAYLGAWYNSEQDRMILDLSEVVESEAEALKLANERGQTAIWDIKNNKEILTK